MPSPQEAIEHNLDRLFNTVAVVEHQMEENKVQSQRVLHKMAAMGEALEIATLNLHRIATNKTNFLDNRIIAKKTLEDIGVVFDAEKEREQREKTKQQN